MKKILSITGELMHFLFLSLPLALTIYIGLHVGLFFYVLFKESKLLCQKITIK